MRHKRSLVLGLLTGFAFAVGNGQAEEFAAGKTTTLPWEDLANPMVVYLPSNYSTDRAWPVIFHYHGTKGDPTVALPKAYTKGEDFVIVGMEYLTRDKPPPKKDYLDIEIVHFREVREFLSRKVRIDRKRCYVGGFSKGGWFGSEFAETHMGTDFAGAYILGAGKRSPDRRKTKRISGKKPVYIGVGQMDENYIYGVNAIKHFKELGAHVTYDEYLGVGHRMPAKLSESFRQWFAIEAARPRFDPVREEAKDWSQSKLAHAEGIEEPVDRYLYLAKLRKMPFFYLLDADSRSGIDKALGVVGRLPELKPELAARAKYLPLLQRELRGGGMEFLRDVADDHHDIYVAHPETYFGKRAGMEVARLRLMLTAFDRWRWPNPEARRKVEAEFAKNPIPNVPVKVLERDFRRVQGILEGG